MFLSKEEQKILDGEKGQAAQKAVEILYALGKIYGADKLIPIQSSQIAGVSYKNLGDAGLEFLENLARDGRVKVKTTLNPAGMDLVDWKKMKIPQDFAEKQTLVIKAFEKLGVEITASCTPYLIGNLPKFGQHVAWGESSAVCYINSVVGARTNREGGPSTIAAALIGKTPNYGLHLEENRKPTATIKVEALLQNQADFGALGKIIGEKTGNKIVYIRGVPKTSLENLKSFGASIATYGGVALYHMENNTPEAKNHSPPKETHTVTQKDLEKAYEELDDAADAELVAVGCPHCGKNELEKIAKLLEGKKVKKEVWINCARRVKNENKKLVEKIEKTGAKVFADTCMVVCPIAKIGYSSLATNSAKAVYYSKGMNKMKIFYGSLEKLFQQV